MSIKSHKPKAKRQPVEEEDDVMPRRQRRKMTLAQLEQRVQRRKAKAGGKSVLGTINNVISHLGKAAQYANRDMSKQASKMPSQRDINKMLWG